VFEFIFTAKSGERRMRNLFIAILAVGAAITCIPAIAQRTLKPIAAPAVSNICPAGTTAGQCFDNAMAAINDLERRVAMLEAQVQTPTQGANNSPSPPARQCPAGTVNGPLGCRPPNAP
jgi:hypothetical protein